MRKFEINVPLEVMPNITTAIHSKNFVFTTKPTTDEDIVKIEVPYEKDSNDEISELEDEINEVIENFYEEEENEEEEEEENEEEEDEENEKKRNRKR